jgi:hypothetical protein
MRLGLGTSLVGALALNLLVVDPATAGSIGIATEVRATVERGSLAVVVKLTNTGDEAARAVVPTVGFRDHEARGESRATLAPSESMETALRLPLGDQAGQWPLVTRADYTDANAYPFQALHVALVSAPPATPALVVVVDVDAKAVVGSGDIHVRVKSLSEGSRQVRVRFHVPRGLEVSPPIVPLTLEPWADATAEAKVVNRAALAGSRYPLFVTVEYDDGIHHAALGHAAVEIRAPRSAPAWLAWVVAAVLLVVWVAVVGYGRLKGLRAPN